MRVVLITLDSHIAGAVERARAQLCEEIPGLELKLHVATNFSSQAAVDACTQDIAQLDLIFASMLFIEEHIKAVLPALQARRDQCDAMVCAMSAGEVMRLTRMGSFTMDGEAKGPLALLKKLRGKSSKAGSSDGGAKQMAMLRNLPKLLRFIPGKAQELRAYFLTLSYFLAGSAENLADLVRLLVNRYADGPRKGLRGQLKPNAPREYPELGLYHPRLPARMTETAAAVPQPKGKGKGTVGLLLLRSYVLSGDAGHYDAVIADLEARGLRVIPCFASGLDARPAIEKFFLEDGQPTVDAVVSLTGFSLVGGPAYNDARAAEGVLSALDVPYVAAHPVEFQTLEEWRADGRGRRRPSSRWRRRARGWPPSSWLPPAAGRAPSRPIVRASGTPPALRPGRARPGAPARPRRPWHRCRPGRRRARSRSARPRRRPRAGQLRKRTARWPGAHPARWRRSAAHAGRAPAGR